MKLELSDNLESAFQSMAKSVAENHIKNSDVLGLGSGSAVARFAKALADRMKRESLKISVVPSSMQSWLIAKENGLPLASDSAHCPPNIDVTVDGADQISLQTRSMIKGGGGALLKEKIIISTSKKCYILAEESKYVSKLERPVPVEVTQFSLLSVEAHILDNLKAYPNLRKLDKGYPFYTEAGNVIVDCQFAEKISDPANLEAKIKCIPGVVEAGIFNTKVDKFYKANKKGDYEAL